MAKKSQNPMQYKVTVINDNGIIELRRWFRKPESANAFYNKMREEYPFASIILDDMFENKILRAERSTQVDELIATEEVTMPVDNTESICSCTCTYCTGHKESENKIIKFFKKLFKKNKNSQ